MTDPVDTPRCAATTRTGRRCLRPAAPDGALCALHARIAAETRTVHHMLRITSDDPDDQSAAVRVLFWAVGRVDEWAGSDDRMAVAVADELTATGGTGDDADDLVTAGVLPGWAAGYVRAQLAAAS